MDLEVKNGVKYLGKYQSKSFEEAYIGIREKENRLFSDEQVKCLPYLENHPLAKEWKLRQESATRFLIALPNKALKILEIGCGNGWFANLLAKNEKYTVVGADINIKELEQAARVFSSSNLTWVYASELKYFEPEKFDMIVLNASVQYFNSLDNLLETLKTLLYKSGTVHIFDSPFYENSLEAKRAESRSIEYYKSLGFPELANTYNHHLYTDVPQAKWHYRPSVIGKMMGKKNPFPWLSIQHSQI